MIQSGDVVRVQYTGSTEQEGEFARSEQREFRIGGGELFPILERALIGMAVGEQKTVHVPAGEAFGPHRPSLVRQVQRDELPRDFDISIGTVLIGEHPSGQILEFVITGLSGDNVQLDANHPLAGKDLVFQVQVIEIVSDTPGA